MPRIEIATCGLCLLFVFAGRAPCQQDLDRQLRSRGIELSTPSLITALGDQDHETRVLAAEKLAKDGDKQAVPQIESALSGEKNGMYRVNMALALAQLGDEKGFDALKSTCSNAEVEDTVRLRASANLAIAGKDDCLNSLLSILRISKDTETTRMALLVLPHFFNPSKRAPKEVLDVVCERLTDPTPAVRLSATDIVSRLGSSTQAPALQAALDKESNTTVHDFMQRNLSTLVKKPAR